MSNGRRVEVGSVQEAIHAASMARNSGRSVEIHIRGAGPQTVQTARDALRNGGHTQQTIARPPGYA